MQFLHHITHKVSPAFHDPLSPWIDNINDFLVTRHDLAEQFTYIVLSASLVVLFVSILIMTFYKKQYALDKATYLREIAFFAVVFRGVTGYVLEWRSPIFTGAVYTLLLFSVLWYLWELVRERGISWNRRNRLARQG